ncbi:hypothetical protein AB0E96_36810 [Kitasatospora sp. NPDC036755]|uniref:hypothetical protein n=1 Tax=Kitasatospora sp. NPDC036755 TaxID=3154600 RepID=UPI0033CC7250
MAADYYRADSENGDHIDDPSEDAIFMLVDDLDDTDNTFLVIQPDEDDPLWYVSVTVLDEGGFEIVRRDANRREHDVITETSIDTIAHDLILWLAARSFPGRPDRRTPDAFQNT